MTKTRAKSTTKGAAKKAFAKKPAARKTGQAGKKPALKKAEASKGKAPGAKKPAKGAVKMANAAQSKMLFKQGDLVVHENGKVSRITKSPYARKTVITVDAVERRGTVDHGDAKAIPAAKFVRPAKAGEKATRPAAVKTKAASSTGKAKGQTEAASDSKEKAKAKAFEPKGKKEASAGDKKTGRKPSVAAAMRELFAERGLEATYAQAETAAKAAKPDTKFSRSHWAWYRAQHKKKGAAPSPPKARA